MDNRIDVRRVRDFHLHLADEASLSLGQRLFCWLLGAGGDEEQQERHRRIEAELARRLRECDRDTKGYRGVTFKLDGDRIAAVVDRD